MIIDDEGGVRLLLLVSLVSNDPHDGDASVESRVIFEFR
jgi:hypothetical protein